MPEEILIEPENPLQYALFLARVEAFRKAWIPDNLRKKYSFVIDKKNLQTVIIDKEKSPQR
ncbi:MAG: hypothetical protein WDK96_00695 [Candidatus Paceibacterota bacterium]|jgi:hypothetical protein